MGTRFLGLALAALLAATPAMAQYLPVGTDSGATNQVTVNTGAAQSIVAARTGGPRTGRAAVTITNTTGTGQLCVGFTSAVTISTGECLPAVAGASITINTTAQIWGAVSVTGQVVSYLETF
jgi:hypothetical protein